MFQAASINVSELSVAGPDKEISFTEQPYNDPSCTGGDRNTSTIASWLMMKTAYQMYAGYK